MQHNEPKGRSCKDCGLVGPTKNLAPNLVISDNWIRNAAPYYVETKLKTVTGPRSLDLSLRRHVDKRNTGSLFKYVPSQGHSKNAVSSSRTTSCEKVIIQSLRSELSAERSLRSGNDRSVQLLSNDLRTLKMQLATLNKQLENAKTQTLLLNESSEKCTAECIQWETKAKVLRQECCRLRTRAMQLENERRKEQDMLLEYRSATLDQAEFSSSESVVRRPCSKDIEKSLNSLLPPDTTAGEALCSRPVSFNIEVIDDLAACSKSSLKTVSPAIAFSPSRGMDASMEIRADESGFNQVSSCVESSSNQAMEMHSPVKKFFNCCSCQLFSSVKLPLPPEVSTGDAPNSKMPSSVGFFCEKLPYSGTCESTADGFQVKQNEKISRNGHFNSLSSKSLKLELIINMLRAANFDSSSVHFSDRLSKRGICSYDGSDVLTVPAVNIGKQCNLFGDGCSTISGDIWAELGIPFFSALRSSAGKPQSSKFFGGRLRSSLKKRKSKSCGSFYFASSGWPEPALQRQSSYPSYRKEYKQNLCSALCRRNFMFDASTTPYTTIMSNADLLQIPADCIEALFSTSGECSKVISDFSVLVYGKSQETKSVSSIDENQLSHKAQSDGISKVKNLSEDAAACNGIKLASLKKEEELYDSFDIPSFKDDLMSTTTSSSFSSDESDREMHTMADWLKQLKLKKAFFFYVIAFELGATFLIAICFLEDVIRSLGWFAIYLENLGRPFFAEMSSVVLAVKKEKP
ncbi:hypothetical protein TTRE_0000835501 [Trichuris trichiura]|uniref:Uncharacterized protein n=1 Tax=Trichuris trichiura TaxID=36087 RepID=A0A077ZHY8_TRITR|nr:hypothetical protein TTRE_0000835501 [Trichuris trichiura]